MTLTQALAVVLGSALGAALTAQLLAFKIAWLALGLLLGGALLYLFAKRFRQRSLGQTALGFGLLFYGMTVMTAAVAPLRASPAVAELLARLEARPVLEFGVAPVLTAIFQSSSVSLALLMTLASLGLVVPGAVTPVISSLGAPGRDAKRTAVADLLFKLANGLVFDSHTVNIAQVVMGIV